MARKHSHKASRIAPSQFRGRRARGEYSKGGADSSKSGVFRAIVRVIGFLMVGALGLGALALGVYAVDLDQTIRAKFEGKRWALPARIYARPLELFTGMELSADQFGGELGLLPYHADAALERPGSYVRNDTGFDLYTRSFAFWDGTEASRKLRVAFSDNKVAQFVSLDGKPPPPILRMEPIEIAGIYPSDGEDRVLVKRKDLPQVLIDTLVAVEDRAFFEHNGVHVKGIVRAMLANLRAGKMVQGGSTLTQQLVKNFFLSNERTLKRKLNEMLMALVIEWRYNKDDILEAYANEIYLGQDGGRAIHGFGLASRFFFDRTLSELDLHHIALLIGLIQGPSHFDPRRYPERAQQRRAVVLDIMREQGLISAADADIANQMPLDVVPIEQRANSPYPAFLDLVRRQLRENYREEDLTSEGLKVFTTLDPRVQAVAEDALIKTLPKLEKQARLRAGLLQGAAVVADTQTGEVRALVGGRDVRLAGFNRALDAKRPAGSLLKPAVYLTALEDPGAYTLATMLDDGTPVVYRPSNGKSWSPQNYDKQYHGRVMLDDALANSYNIATARLGLDLDVLNVVKTLQRIGLQRDLQPYPSILLGAVDMAPVEVAQMYATFASGGYRMPLRTIREVTAANGKPLPRLYELRLEKAIEPGPAYLITSALQRVVQDGTAALANKFLPKELGLAGKTGTTDDLRDSWFAGFSGNVLSVAWVGRDDNQPIRLSGAKGALPLWIELMKDLPLTPVDGNPPADIEMVLIDPRSGQRANRGCSGARSLPFLAGSAPQSYAACGSSYISRRDYGRSGDDVEDTESVGAIFKRLLE
ncbi:MAG: penicillin-binding protein 1B [Gammaproteobacteria bacterium]